MNQDDPIRVAKDKKSTHEMLTGLVGVSDDVDRLLARHPSATAEILSRLSKSSDATVRRRVLANPATPKDVLISLGPKYPATFFKNPALDSILRADKKFLLAFEAPTLLKLLGHKDCPAYFGEWALKKGSAEQQAVYLFKCRRPDAVMQKFTKSKHFEIAAALLENVDCIYESWARELGWIPDPPEDLGLDDEPIPIRMQIDYWVETTSEKCNPLWKTLVPEEGVAETVQGELVRAIGRIQGEFYKNGMMNWGSGFYESFKDYLAVWLKSDATYDSFTKKIIDADIWQIEKSGETGKTIAEGKLSRSAIFGGNILNTTDVEVSHRRIGALVSLWCEAHPDAISNNSYVMPRDRVAQLRSPAEYLTLTTPCNICGGVVKETDLDFQCVGKGVVFWHDVEAEFASVVGGLQLDGVQLVRLDDTPALRIKLDIERAPDQRWLIYSTQPEPEPTKDWLLDVRLRSKSFRADSTSILLEDLGLTTQALRHHLKERAKFLRAKDRVDRLKRLVLPGDGALDLDRKMLAVLTRSDQPDCLPCCSACMRRWWWTAWRIWRPSPKPGKTSPPMT
jgi:hypothetical protein